MALPVGSWHHRGGQRTGGRLSLPLAPAVDAQRRCWLHDADAVVERIEDLNLHGGDRSRVPEVLVLWCENLGLRTRPGTVWQGAVLHDAMMTLYEGHLLRGPCDDGGRG